MRILVTRPEPDADRLAKRLAGAGHTPFVEPMMSVAQVSGSVDLAGVQALAFTSANGVRAFAARSEARSLPVFAVGEATAAAARAEGFARVHVAGGDVDHLAALLGAMLDPEEGALLHVAGKTVAGDLGAMLAGFGFEVRRAVLYGTEPAAALSEDLKTQIAGGQIDGVTLYSPRTARIFVDLVIAAGLKDAAAAMTCYALSENVAAAAAGLPWGGVQVAARPDEDALLNLFEKD